MELARSITYWCLVSGSSFFSRHISFNTEWTYFFSTFDRLTNICIDPENGIRYFPPLCELRVLKICSISLSLRRTVEVYWRSLVKMRDLLLYILFAMFVASVACMQMYMGVLSQHCVKIPNGFRGDEAWSNFVNDPGELRIALQFLFVWSNFVSFILSFFFYINSAIAVVNDFALCNVDS